MSKVEMKTITINGPLIDGQDKVLTRPAIRFLEKIAEKFESEREKILEERLLAQAAFHKGALPSFLKDTQAIRNDSSWKVAPIPKNLEKRWVEITGPVERKMMINALNSGADVFMADFEDSLSPTWKNVIEGQINLKDAVNQQLTFKSPDGKVYVLNEKTAILMVRPRGFHLVEKHCLVEGKPISASFFDFGLYLFHNYASLLQKDSVPYFYLPKLESHKEAKLWNEVISYAEEFLSIPKGTIKVTVLIETIPAAFEMEEILFSLKDYIVGLNAGRWDYIFSIIKKFSNQSHFLFPDRSQITMTVPFMRAYTRLLVHTCHKRGAHAMGGMAAFIPSRKDPQVNAKALAKVEEDKLREIDEGFDGTWVAHPDLVPLAHSVFDKRLKGKSHQKERILTDFVCREEDLLNFAIPDSEITEEGFKQNVSVALQYIYSWLKGQGAVAIHNLMEDAATAEISRSQLWQWIHHGAAINNNFLISKEFFEKCLIEEIQKNSPSDQLNIAAKILSHLVKEMHFEDFFTTLAYQNLE